MHEKCICIPNLNGTNFVQQDDCKLNRFVHSFLTSAHEFACHEQQSGAPIHTPLRFTCTSHRNSWWTLSEDFTIYNFISSCQKGRDTTLGPLHNAPPPCSCDESPSVAIRHHKHLWYHIISQRWIHILLCYQRALGLYRVITSIYMLWRMFVGHVEWFEHWMCIFTWCSSLLNSWYYWGYLFTITYIWCCYATLCYVRRSHAIGLHMIFGQFLNINWKLQDICMNQAWTCVFIYFKYFKNELKNVFPIALCIHV